MAAVRDFDFEPVDHPLCSDFSTICHSGGFRGGAQPVRAPPPLLKHFSINAPLWKKKKKKKKVSDSARYTPVATYPPPPPPAVDCAPDQSVRKKSVGVPPPPPPPPLISFFGTCASFEAGGGPIKLYVVAPPFSNSGSAPDLPPSDFSTIFGKNLVITDYSGTSL